jgi:hypothetical protein
MSPRAGPAHQLTPRVGAFGRVEGATVRGPGAEVRSQEQEVGGLPGLLAGSRPLGEARPT